MRRSIFARVKFLSRLFTALNLLPSSIVQGYGNGQEQLRVRNVTAADARLMYLFNKRAPSRSWC
jgi:hypothetical protein